MGYAIKTRVLEPSGLSTYRLKFSHLQLFNKNQSIVFIVQEPRLTCKIVGSYTRVLTVYTRDIQSNLPCLELGYLEQIPISPRSFISIIPAQVFFLQQLPLTQTHMNKIRVYFLSIYNDCHALCTTSTSKIGGRFRQGKAVTGGRFKTSLESAQRTYICLRRPHPVYRSYATRLPTRINSSSRCLYV